MRSLAVLLLFVALPAMPAEEMVSVPLAELEALRAEHVALKATIDEQAKRLTTLADAALSCYSNFRHFRES